MPEYSSLSLNTAVEHTKKRREFGDANQIVWWKQTKTHTQFRQSERERTNCSLRRRSASLLWPNQAHINCEPNNGRGSNEVRFLSSAACSDYLRALTMFNFFKFALYDRVHDDRVYRHQLNPTSLLAWYRRRDNRRICLHNLHSNRKWLVRIW